MNAIILKSRPQMKFHFGITSIENDTTLGTTSPICHSDTLWSALVDCCSKLGGEHLNRVLEWSHQGKIKLSSIFFYLQFNGKKILFLPVPTYLYTKRVKYEVHKKLKKIKYLSLGVIHNGIKPEKWFEDECVIIDNEFVIMANEVKGLNKIAALDIKIYSIVSEPKTRVSYKEEKGNFYYQTNVSLCTDVNYSTGYYFLMEHDLSPLEYNNFQKYLNLTLSFGLGGELSTGCGQFEGSLSENDRPGYFEENEFDCGIAQGNLFFSVSLSIPDADEINQSLCHTIVMRGGRRFSGNIRARVIEMLTEGAVFRGRISGSITNLTPAGLETPVLRNGKPLLLPLHHNYYPEESEL